MKFLQLSVLALMFGLTGMTHAVDIQELSATCDSCHGPQGASSSSDVPIIGGQSREFIEDTLRSFRSWGRPCIKSSFRHGDTSRPKTDMCKVAESLSDADITALSNHYSELPFVSASQEFDVSQAKAGAVLHEKHCENCHEQGGASAAGRGPRTAGQWVVYMKSTLKLVPTGEHRVPPIMERGLEQFDTTEIDALMNFYASQQNQEKHDTLPE